MGDEESAKREEGLIGYNLQGRFSRESHAFRLIFAFLVQELDDF